MDGDTMTAITSPTPTSIAGPLRRFGAAFVLCALFAAAIVGISGGSLFGSWSGTGAAATATATGGTITLADTPSTLTFAASYAPGDTWTRYIDANASGTIAISSATFSLTGWATQTTNLGVNVKARVDYCSSGYLWATPGTGNPTCTTWTSAGTASTLGAAGACASPGAAGCAGVNGNTIDTGNGGTVQSLLSGAYPTTSGTKAGLRVIVYFCDGSNVPANSGCTTEVVPTTFQGLSSGAISLNVTGTARAGTSLVS
jgi:hypothetical protein